MSNDLVSLFESQLSNHLKKSQIENRNEIISLINTSFLWTSNIDNFFANQILFESETLIKNSILQFEEGFFDAAIYSLRQSIENMLNTLYLIKDKKQLIKWINKERFPYGSEIIKKLETTVENYAEIKKAIPFWFAKYDLCNKEANKYIHKQGYDTFYDLYKTESKVFDKVNRFYNKFLKYSIAHLYILYIAINPISLILSDEELHSYVHADLLDEPLPVSFMETVIGIDNFIKIKQTPFYVGLEEHFKSFEKLNYYTEVLLKYQIIDYEHLDEINSQRHLLGLMEKVVLDIANEDIKVSYIFFSDILISPYKTSIESNYSIYSFHKNMFDGCFESRNLLWNGVFCNIFKYGNERYIALISNDKLSEEEMQKVESIIDKEQIAFI